MKKIIDVDPNYRFNTDFYREDMHFYDVRKEPFSVHGLLWENDGYCRMPEETAKKVNAGVHQLSRNTAGQHGGAIVLWTDKDRIMAALSTAQREHVRIGEGAEMAIDHPARHVLGAGQRVGIVVFRQLEAKPGKEPNEC